MNPLDPTTHSPTEASETPKPRRRPPNPRSPAVRAGSQPWTAPRSAEIASKGGKAAHAAGTAHQFSSDEARNAGRKGGVAPHVRRGRGPRNPNVSPPKSGEPKEGATE